MEYTKLISLKNDLLLKTDFVKNNLHKTNPIDRYNYFVKQYNIDYIRHDDDRMLYIEGHSIYSFLTILQNSIFNYLIIFGVIPVMVYLTSLLIKGLVTLYFIIYTIYFSIIFVIALTSLIIYLEAKRRYNLNIKRVPNPFKRMIFHPDLCRVLGVNNAEIDYSIDRLDNLNLTETQMNVIKNSTLLDGKVKFIIYDNTFIEYYSEIGQYNLSFLKPIFWFISSIGFYILFIYINNESD